MVVALPQSLNGSVYALNDSFFCLKNITYSQICLASHNTLTRDQSDLVISSAEPFGYLGTLYDLKAVLTTLPHLILSHHLRPTHRQSWSSMMLSRYPLLYPAMPSVRFGNHAQSIQNHTHLLS